MKFFNSLIGCTLLWTLVTWAALAQDAESPTPPSSHDTMIVLDASGSMWGQIDGEAKISIAKTVVGDILTDWDEDLGLGLMAYGHRREGDCSDIETLVSVADGTATSVSSKVKGLNPKGKTPITESLRQAASALKYKEKGATVILVSDGLETCNADPCALAKNLEADGVDFTAHIIGFGLKEEEFKSLQCIATETGGEHFTANNAEELTGALRTTVKAVRETGPKGLKVYAAACEDCSPYKGVAFLWSVFELDENDEKTGASITSGSTQGYHVPLAPGRYYVEGQIDYNKSIRTGEIVEVNAEGVTTKTLVIPAGRVKVSAIPNENGPEIKSNLRYSFMSVPQGDAKPVQYANVNYSKDPVWLPAGEVLVTASHGKSDVTQSVTVISDGLSDLIFNMNVGYLNVSARLTEADPILNGSSIWINRDVASASSSNSLDYTTRMKVGRFILAEGDYIATSESGNARGSTKASVKAGETTEVIVTINAGRANLKAGYVEGEPVNGVLWEILDSDGKRVALGSNQARFTLNEGTFTAVVAKNYKNAGRQEFEVKAGELSEVFFVLPKPEE